MAKKTYSFGATPPAWANLTFDPGAKAGDKTVFTKVQVTSFDYETTTQWAALPPIDAKMLQDVMRSMENQIRQMYTLGYFIAPLPADYKPWRLEEDEPMPKLPGRAARCITHQENVLVPAGKVAFTRGAGTFNARLRLKALGGRWHPDLLGGVWLVPEEFIHEAAQNIRLGAKSSVELPVGDDPVSEQVEKITCYVCGTKYLPWEFAKLTGSSVGEWYCGCAERTKGPAPRTAQVRR